MRRLDERIDADYRAAAVDELVQASNVRAAGPLVEARARELLNGFVRSLASRGITPEAYFQTTGQTPEVLTAQVRAEAAQSVARELALEALAEQGRDHDLRRRRRGVDPRAGRRRPATTRTR